MNKSLALFDFDGTITTKDSLAEFIKFAVGKKLYYLGLLRLSPVLFMFVTKLLPNDVAKQKMMAYFFKGWCFDKFQTIADNYAQTEINNIIRPQALQKINWHKKQGHRVIIVSASMENWLQKWCESLEIELIATKLKVINNKITGKFLGKNCHGEEKVNRIKILLNLSTFNVIYAYGDSSGDKAMLELADTKFYRFF